MSLVNNSCKCLWETSSVSISGKRLRDYVLTPFDDPSIFAEKGLASGSESLFTITDTHPQAALSALASLDLPFPIQNFLVQSLPGALPGLNGDYDPMRGIRHCKRRAVVKPVQEACALAASACRRARFDGTLQAPGEARKRSQRNGPPPQQRGK